jgi:hypothetical protein
MVNVQKASLGRFEQNALALLDGPEQKLVRIDDMGPHPFGVS